MGIEKRESMGVEPESKVKGEVGLEARLWKLCAIVILKLT